MLLQEVLFQKKLRKIETQTCVKLELVQQLINIEAYILSKAADPSVSFSCALETPLDKLAVASKSTQETICKWASIQLQEKEKSSKCFNKTPSDYRGVL